jgi:hypothetical protein
MVWRCPFAGVKQTWQLDGLTSDFDPDCVKTRASQERAELFSQ